MLSDSVQSICCIKSQSNRLQLKRVRMRMFECHASCDQAIRVKSMKYFMDFRRRMEWVNDGVRFQWKGFESSRAAIFLQPLAAAFHTHYCQFTSILSKQTYQQRNSKGQTFDSYLSIEAKQKIFGPHVKFNLAVDWAQRSAWRRENMRKCYFSSHFDAVYLIIHAKWNVIGMECRLRLNVCAHYSTIQYIYVIFEVYLTRVLYSLHNSHHSGGDGVSGMTKN